MKSSNDVYMCDFCGKKHHDVETIVTGLDGVAICDECIELSMEILAERRGETKKGSSAVIAVRAWATKALRRR